MIPNALAVMRGGGAGWADSRHSFLRHQPGRAICGSHSYRQDEPGAAGSKPVKPAGGRPLDGRVKRHS